VLDKQLDGSIVAEEHGEFRFVPLLEDRNWLVGVLPSHIAFYVFVF
jgi:hypothetical protein